MKGPYDDIIHLPRPVSRRRPRMSNLDRAAQFAPFAALTGHEEAVKETARLTVKKLELDEQAKQILNRKLRIIAERIEDMPRINIRYFVPDDKKEGGRYVTADGRAKKLDEFEKVLIMADGKEIPIEDIIEIEGGIF
ncbi:MAG: hypothetical protein GXX01_05860 [Clostridiales bacterium]|jgi:hypothetical protein|nr:hypothetical protein [Clostridiales bacterium]